MQDPSAFQPMRPPPFPEQERLKCPRCDSTNTKFCYYNNYNLSQPRHFCKHCRRYWTKGGSLRNIPVGGGTRKNAAKRPASSSPTGDSNPKRPELVSEPETKGQVSGNDSMTSPPLPTAATAPAPSQTSPSTSGAETTRSYFPNLAGGSFSSLLASNMQFGSILEGINSSGSGSGKMVQLGGFGAVENLNSDPNMDRGPPEPNNGGSEPDSYLSLQNGGENSSCWGSGGSNWPDLAIYTPSSRFQ